MATVGDIVVKFGIDDGEFNRGLTRVEKGLKQSAERYTAMGSAMTSLITGPLVGLAAGLTAIAVKSGAAEKSHAKLKASTDALGAAFASSLEPALMGAMDAATGAAKWFTALDDDTKSTIVQVAALAAAAGPAAMAIGKMQKATAAFIGLLRTTNLVTLGWIGAIVGVTAAIVELSGVLDSEDEKRSKFEASQKNAISANTAAVKSYRDRIDVLTSENLALAANDKAFRNESAMIANNNAEIARLTERIAYSETAIKGAADAKFKSTRASAGLTMSEKELAEAAKKAADEKKKLFGYTMDSIAAFDQERQAIDDLASMWGTAATITVAAEEKKTKATNDTTAALERQAKAQAVIAGRQQSEMAGIWQGVGAVGALASGQISQISQQIASAFDPVAGAFVGALAPVIDALGKAEEQAKAELNVIFSGLATQLENVLSNMDVLFVAFAHGLENIGKGLIRGFGALAVDVWEKVLAPFGDAFRDAGEWVADLFHTTWADISKSFFNIFADIGNALLDAIDSFIPGNAFGSIEYRADGGPVAAGRPYMVGERGPEMFVPAQAGAIVPNGGVTININGGRDSADVIAQRVAMALRSLQRGGRISGVGPIATMGVAA